jgi:ABC-type Zn uptake system ZnuABC Zn-binding protein ZnuA
MRSRAGVTVVLGVLVIALAAGCGSKKSSTGATTTSGSGSKSFASVKNCKDLEGLAAKVSQSFQPNANGETDLKKEADALNALADAAPSDIKGDFKTFADAFENFAKAYGDVKLKPGATPSAEQIAKLATLSQSLNTPKLQKAMQHLSAWGSSHCGISSTG